MTISISFLCFLIKIFEFLFSTQKNFQFWDISLFYLLSFLFFSSSLWDKVKQIKAKQSKEMIHVCFILVVSFFLCIFLLCFCFALLLLWFISYFFSSSFFFPTSFLRSFPFFFASPKGGRRANQREARAGKKRGDKKSAGKKSGGKKRRKNDNKPDGNNLTLGWKRKNTF